jgi:very-short-patch-repair endonuclease|tara:strand:- start:13044 stop:13448 length:405 start_codon:yes stop_codon:yes gene_type:complete
MVFKTLFGSTRKVKAARKYLIDWESGSRSKVQNSVKKYLKKYWLHDIVFEEFPLVGSRMTFDFYNATKNIVIEVQGKQHTKFVPFMHANSKMNYLKQLKRDEDKIKFCNLNKIVLLEYFDGDNTLSDLDKLLDF